MTVPCEPVHQFVVFSSDIKFVWPDENVRAHRNADACAKHTFNIDSHSFVCWPSIVPTIEF